MTKHPETEHSGCDWHSDLDARMELQEIMDQPEQSATEPLGVQQMADVLTARVSTSPPSFRWSRRQAFWGLRLNRAAEWCYRKGSRK